MEALIPINVVIGDRSYRIRIDPKDEETVRGTVKVINDKIIEYKTQFAGKDMQDYIGMVVLWYATQQKTAGGTQPPEILDISDKLNQIEALLDKPLK
jgi:cell division protein ZapA